MASLNSDKGAITSLDQSWEGHSHYEVEQFLKDQIETLGGQVVRSKISLAIDGNSIKSFLNGASNVSFGYTVTYTKDNVDMTSCKIRISVGSKVVYNGDTVAGSLAQSPNIASYLNALSDSVIYVTLRAYDIDDEGNETAYSTARVTYNKQTATTVNTVALGTVDPATLTFNINFSTDEATLFAEFYDASGVTLLSTVKRTFTSKGDATVQVPTLTKGAHVVKAYLVLNDIEETRGNTASTTIISTNGANDGDIFIVVGTVDDAVVNDYVDIQFSAYVYRTSNVGDEVIPIAMEELSGNTYVTKAVRNAANGARQTWHYLVKSDLVNLRIGVPQVDSNGDLVYSRTGVLQFEEGDGNPVQFSFEATQSTINWVTPENSVAYFTAQNKSNNDFDIGTWENSGKSFAFEDVQWNSAGSGWKDIKFKSGSPVDDSTTTDKYDNTSTALHLVGTSKAYIKDFYPFYDTTVAATLSGGGILAKGRTLKMSFMIRNVSNPDERIIDCFDDQSKTGFYVTGNAIYINLGEELVSLPEEGQAKAGHNARRFSADTKLDLTITVQPYYENGAETKHELRYYINGEIAGFAVLEATSLSQTNPTLLKFGGSGAILDLFDVRYYDKALSSFKVLQMRTMDLDSSAEIAETFNKNNFYETDSDGSPVITLSEAIEYGKYLASQGITDFAVWACTNLCNGEAYIGNTKTHSTRAESFYLYKFKQDADGKGIIDPDYTIFVEAMGIDTDKAESYLRLRRQGTSTASSTKGNIRLDVRNTCRIHKYNASTGKFYEWDGDPTHCYEVKKKAAIWQIPNDDTIACQLLTCKKNPNESTQARNLPTAKWYEDCCRYLATINTGTSSAPVYKYEDCLTMPQRKELQSIIENNPDLSRTDQIAKIKTRQCVNGIPSLGFEIGYSDDDSTKNDPLSNTATFGGQFDLITDKSNMTVFGFGGYNTQDADGNVTWHSNEDDEDFSAEWRQNDSAVCNFLTADLSTLSGDGSYAAKAMEYRYPVDYPTEDVVTPVSPAANSDTWKELYPNGTRGMALDGPIQRLFDFVRTCALDKADVANEGTYYSGGEVQNYTKPGQIPIGEVTLGEANLNPSAYTWKTDNVTNRVEKFHTELGHYVTVNQILFNGLAIIAALMCDQDTKNQFFTHFTGEYDENGKQILRLLGYDFDSSWGIDNDNFFRFLYTVLYDDGLYDGRGIDPVTKEEKGPMFWKLIFKAFKSEMATIANLLYSGFLSKDALLKYMETNQVNLYNALIYNANSEYSYTSSAADYLKTHGSAKEHTRWFIEGRMHFLSGRLSVGSTTVGGDFATNAANFNLAIFSNELIAEYPLNAANRGKDDWAIEVQGYERTAACLRYGAGGFFPVVEVNVNTTYDSNYKPINVEYETAVVKADSTIGSSAGDNRLAIFGGKHLKSVKGLSRWYIANVMDWGDLTNIEELEIGSTENLGTEENPEYYRNPNLTSLALSKTFGSCKKFNTAGCPSLQGNFSLSSFPVLEEFEGIRMDGVTSITLPISNSLKKISYPKNLTSWTVDNKPNLESITFEGTDSLTSISVTNSSQYAASYAVTLLNNMLV
jgi:hypothetical protein